MKISIITATWNSAATIENAILSVASQRHPDLEHIIVDGNSSDATLPIVFRHADKIDKLISEPDHGIYDAMNKGISLATGMLSAFSIRMISMPIRVSWKRWPVSLKIRVSTPATATSSMSTRRT